MGLEAQLHRTKLAIGEVVEAMTPKMCHLRMPQLEAAVGEEEGALVFLFL